MCAGFSVESITGKIRNIVEKADKPYFYTHFTEKEIFAMAEEIKETETKQAQPETPAEKTYSEADYNALKVQLDEANQAIQSFKDMDIESIQKSADDWKKKYDPHALDNALTILTYYKE